MTTDTTAGYQPVGHETPQEPVGGSGSGSTTDAAKDQAAQVGQTAKDKTSEVASTAADQAKNVAEETKTQARNVLAGTQSQVREQAGIQKDKASGGLRDLSDQLRAMADGTGTQQGVVTDLARQASGKAQDLAGWLESRQPGDLVEEVRNLARRKPGAFLVGAAVAGVLAGRLTRGTVDAKRSEGSVGTDQNARMDSAAAETNTAEGLPYEPGASPSMWAEPATTPGGDRL
jgi:hypothetical protein